MRHWRWAAASGAGALLAVAGLTLTPFAPDYFRASTWPYLIGAAAILFPVALLLRQRRLLIVRLAASEGALRIMAENSGDVMLHVDAEGRIIQASGALETLFGRDAGWMLGRHATELVIPADRAAVTSAHAQLLAEPGETVSSEFRARMRDGSNRWFESRARAVLDPQARTIGTVSAIRDVDARKRTEAELSLAATTDALTGLLNRRAFFSYYDLMTGEGRGGVLIAADLDHFKSINDRFGHHVGDAVLQDFARLAREALRKTDVVARIGGEEFAFFLPGAQLDQGYALCDRLSRALAEAGRDGPCAVTASMGMITINLAETAAAALKRADTALYAAKEAGRDCLRLAA